MRMSMSDIAAGRPAGGVRHAWRSNRTYAQWENQGQSSAESG
jgi:hypothetical protein